LGEANTGLLAAGGVAVSLICIASPFELTNLVTYPTAPGTDLMTDARLLADGVSAARTGLGYVRNQ